MNHVFPELPTWHQRQQELYELIQQYTLMSDLFMSTVLADKEACQHVLRIILKDPGLIVREVVVQKTMSQLYGKSSRLDVTAEDSKGRLLNIEVQNQPEKNHARRLRFYSGVMANRLLSCGDDYSKLPDQIMIYISSSDIWKKGLVLYEFQMTESTLGISAGDGLRYIYVNMEIDDGSAIAKLMQYFKTADPLDQSQGALSQQVNYYKINREGLTIMCEICEKLRNDGRAEGIAESNIQYAKKLAAKGMSLDEIAQIAETDVATVKQWLEM